MRRSSEANRRTSSAPRDEKVGLIVICFKTCQIVFQSFQSKQSFKTNQTQPCTTVLCVPILLPSENFSQINNVIFFEFLTEIGLIGQPKREVSNLKRLSSGSYHRIDTIVSN